ncbi:MAG TPA: 23S rRNA (adenine(2503)-C(2))-methyltransferase RlmN, partial [Clostridiales bacterium]|nr:23S rRNA (adenine(2503)-C(2))-methyltransferase RlmN [Clostridiales bacterium]
MNELASITTEELGLLLEELHEPKFRTSQVMKWLAKGVPPKEMLNIPKTLREKLSAFPFGGVGIIECKQSKKDDTAKMLYETEDGNVVEGVLMRYSYGNTLCISTQAGCRMGCAFCASTLNGKVRDLTAGEMLSEITAV